MKNRFLNALLSDLTENDIFPPGDGGLDGGLTAAGWCDNPGGESESGERRFKVVDRETLGFVKAQILR
jgi:hypothetical protein